MRACAVSALVAADALVAAVGEHAQELGLQRGVEVADLVEEERAGAGGSMRPVRRPAAPVKAPLSWPNSSLSISVGGSAARFTATNGCRRARRVVVDGARHQLLAGAGLAGDEHRRVGGGGAADQLPDGQHRRRGADQARRAPAAAAAWPAPATAPRCLTARSTVARSAGKSNGLVR